MGGRGIEALRQGGLKKVPREQVDPATQLLRVAQFRFLKNRNLIAIPIHTIWCFYLRAKHMDTRVINGAYFKFVVKFDF